jgi:hypothetical protein
VYRVLKRHQRQRDGGSERCINLIRTSRQ